MTDKTAIRYAATIIVVRDRPTAPRILMGQRGSKAAFMPNKFVFPGGAVDAGDADIRLAGPPNEPCQSRLLEGAPARTVHALAVAAIREMWEETGQVLGRPGPWPETVPQDWTDFAGMGLLPWAAPLRFVFRAITPPGRPRRFDARFFLVDASHLMSDPDDFSRASDELNHLQWIPLAEARDFDLPFITEVVLAEIAALISGGAPSDAPPASVPFFNNSDEASLFERLYGRPQSLSE